MPPSAAPSRTGARWHSTRSRPRRVPSGCRSWSAAPASTSGRSRKVWPRFPKSPNRSGTRRSSSIGFWAASRSASGWRSSTRPARERLFPGDRQRLVRAYEVVRATGVPLAMWQRRPHPSSPYRFSTILLEPPRDRLYAACEGRFTRMIEAGALAEAAALAARGLDPDLPAMKAVGLPELLRHLHGEMPLDRCHRGGTARHQAIREASDDLVSPSDCPGPEARRAIFARFAAPLAPVCSRVRVDRIDRADYGAPHNERSASCRPSR